MTYFDTISKSFKDVTVTTEGIATAEFLEACDSLVQMFNLFNSSAFSMVQSDITTNIKKVRTRYLTDESANRTVELLVENEKTEKKRIATEGLVWLNRGLKFTHAGLQRSYENPSEELSASFTKAYEGTLKQYHSFVVRPVFTLAMKACPYRADLLQRMGEPADKVHEQLGEWLTGLQKIVTRIDNFYDQGGHAKGF